MRLNSNKTISLISEHNILVDWFNVICGFPSHVMLLVYFAIFITIWAFWQFVLLILQCEFLDLCILIHVKLWNQRWANNWTVFKKYGLFISFFRVSRKDVQQTYSWKRWRHVELYSLCISFRIILLLRCLYYRSCLILESVSWGKTLWNFNGAM